ncbi:MAG: polysaccharide biosynthesis protein [Bacilli bacterium]|nr:polysaccharide biosynthesis protein [Bacilli bacterium]
MTKRRVMFISSTGGHLNELLQLEKMFKEYNYSLITEKTKSNLYLKDKYGKRVGFLIYGTKHHILTYPFKLLVNCFISLYYYLKFRPDYIITTGVHTAGPMCCIGKMLGSKVIYIETFANMVTKTTTGKLLYPIVDKFIVQWESMKDLYPNADFGGWIF